MPTILGANSASDAYEITNSLRYNYGDGPRLTKSGTSAGSTTFTFSAWVKLSTLDYYNFIFCSGNQVGLAREQGETKGQFYLNGASGGTYTNSTGHNRDCAAWYHVVVSCNSGTGIIYVNNENRKGSIQIPQLADDLAIGHFYRTEGVGTPQYNYYMDGYISEVHFVDGSALNPTSFAEYDSNGVWIPKDCKDDLTYGSNGFCLEFKQTGTSANSSGIGADTSGNDNHFTPANLAAIDVCTDTPTNNFCTLNGNFRSTLTMVEGGTKVASGADNTTLISTQHSKAGYFECKYGGVALNNGAGFRVGIVSWDDHSGRDADGTTLSYNSTGDLFWVNNTNSAQYRKHTPNTTTNLGTSKWSAPGTSDILGVAWRYDSPNGIWFSINGVWYNGSGSASTTLDTSNPDFSINDKQYIPIIISSLTGGNDCVMNFGQPSFAISSGNSDANGYGNFEYAVPDGFYALCTKNLAQYG